jgi:hypothetical protein
MPLHFSDVPCAPMPLPPPRPNGGWFTGEACRPGGGWCSVPVTPDALALRDTLRSANPPPGAIRQPTSDHRPGNNDYRPDYIEFNGLRCPR